jgi:hypothetical protein
MEQLTKNRSAANTSIAVPAVRGLKNCIHDGDAFYFFRMEYCPGQTERAADVMNNQMHWLTDTNGYKESVDEFSHPIKGDLKAGGHCRPPEPGKVRHNASVRGAHDASNVIPHSPSIRNAMQKEGCCAIS